MSNLDIVLLVFSNLFMVCALYGAWLSKRALDGWRRSLGQREHIIDEAYTIQAKLLKLTSPITLLTSIHVTAKDHPFTGHNGVIVHYDGNWDKPFLVVFDVGNIVYMSQDQFELV